MGLDAVNLVMAIEEEFNIVISDADAERIMTVSDLCGCLRQLVEIKMRPPPSDEEIWQRVRKIIVAQLAVKPQQVTPDARFIQDLGVD